MPGSDTAGLAGTTVPHVQQTQHPATPMQLTDIISQAAPQQTQSVMIPQQTIVPQQQIGMDPQTSTLQQQLQPQVGAQAAELEQQQVNVAQPATEQHQQSLSATSIEKHQSETQQQICVQQPAPHVQTTLQQHVFTTQTGMEHRTMSALQPGEQIQTYIQQPAGDPCEQTVVQSQLQQQLQQQQTLLQQQKEQQQQQALLLEQHQLYVQQQLDQQQQIALIKQQQQQQVQLQQQQALKQKQLLEQQQQQQQQALIQQKQEQKQGVLQQEQMIFQHQLEQQLQKQPSQQQQQSQLYQQIGQLQAGTQKETENQQQSGQNDQQILLQQEPQQTQQQNEQMQQQALIRQMEQQQARIQQQLIIQQQQQLQQKAQLQQQEQQQAQLKQQIEQQQQALLQQQLEQQRQQQVLLQQQAERLQQQALIKQQIQEQQQAAIIQLQQIEKHEAVPIPQSNSEQQICQQPADIQHMSIPQLNSTHFTPHASQQQVIEQQQQVVLMQQQQQQQQAFVAQPHQHASVMEAHISVGGPVSTEAIHHQTHIMSQAQVAMTIPTTQIPVQTPASVPVQILSQQGQSEVQPQNQGQIPAQFIAQSTAQVSQAMTENQVTPPLSLIQGHTQLIQSQQIPSQSSYPGPVTPIQNQLTSPRIQTHPLSTNFTQSQPMHGHVPKVDIQMLGQQGQTIVQPPAAISSIPSQIQNETIVQQNAQMPGLIQPQLQQQTQGQQTSQFHSQPAAGPLTTQYVPQPTQQAIPPVQPDITRVAQQLEQQQPVIQYQQMILSPGSAGSGGTKTDGLSSVAAPLHPLQAVQAQVPGQRSLHTVVQADPSVIQSMSQPAVPQYTEQYQQQLPKLSHVQQSLVMPPPQAHLPAQPIPTPIQQPLPMKRALIPPDESQLPSQCQPTSPLMTLASGQLGPCNVAEPQSQSRTLPLYSHPVPGAPPSPQHQPKQMLPALTHAQSSNQAQAHSQTLTHVQTQSHPHTQTHIETPTSEQPILSQTVFPAQQMPLSPLHTSCPPTLPCLTSLPSTYPTTAPTPELPTSPPTAQVTLPGQADFIPASPLPVTTLQSLDSNAPKLTQASLQDCDLSLLGIAQVQEV